MISIKQEGRVVELHLADVFSIEHRADTYTSLDSDFVSQGMPEDGHIREVVFRLTDGTALVVYAMSNNHIPIVDSPDLDGEALAGELKGKPLPTAQEVAAGIAAQFERDSQAEDGDEPTSH
jgi:hypothetical protein